MSTASTAGTWAGELRASGFEGTLDTTRAFAQLTTYRLGGPIALFVEPATPEDFHRLGAFFKATRLSHLFLGGGTNLLASSRRYDGIVMRLGPAFKAIEAPGPSQLKVGGAAQTAQLLKYCQREVLGGLEMLAGVPGTVGGAVAMNAGTMKDWLERSIESVTAVDPQWQAHVLHPAECGFRYRGSRLLDEGWRILDTTFNVAPDVDIALHIREHLAMRRRTQPGGRNAGSNFKNPPGLSAGALIDQAGCKGWREGSAVVSDLHANFIQAEADCTPEAVYILMQRVARAVEHQFQVRLEPEVALINFPDSWETTWGVTEG